MMTAQPKGRRLAKSNPWPTVLACLILLAALSLAFGLGAMLATAGREDKPPQTVATSTATQEPSAVPTEPPELIRHRDDIVSEGRLLPYDLQETMQDYCEVYGVPYALALAIAEVETHFDPDAVSPTHDYGLMQINQCNHEWLQSLGMDPLTYAGNIEAGLYMIGNYLSKYGDTEMALMAYNNGPGGARKLWDAGTYQTDYTRKVMTALELWTSILEE
ncbi:transglycosylase SLT domain-containing protein [Oscillospiraceae bacterium 44-5]